MDFDLEKGEKAAKVLLRTALDFLDRDIKVVKDCLTGIDNIAGDFFEPEILSKEILLASAIDEKDVWKPGTC